MFKKIFRNIVIAIFVLGLGVYCNAASYRIGSSQNSFSFNGKGQIAGWKSGRVRYITKAQAPFLVRDVVTGEEDEFTGTVARSGQDLLFKGTSAKLKIEIKAVFSPMGNGINVKAMVEDQTGADRAIDFCFRLRLAKSPWRYCSYWEPTPDGVLKTCAGNNYSQTVKVGKVPMSQAPWLLVDDTRHGIMLSHSLFNPRFFNYVFHHLKNGQGELSLKVPLGLSQDTKKFPGKATIEFSLTTFEGGTFTRGGVLAYYDLYPEIFRSRIGYPGAWSLWIPEEALELTKFCGMGFNQREYDFDLLAGINKGKRPKAIDLIEKTQAAGMKVMVYSEPWGVYIPFPNGWRDKNLEKRKRTSKDQVVINDDSLKKYVENFRGDQHPSDRFPGELKRNDIYEIIQNCAAEIDDEGRWGLNAYGKKGFRWGTRRDWDTAMLVLNSDPDLKRPNRMDITWEKARYGYVLEKAKEYGFTIDGLYLDSELYYAGWNEVNYRRDQWAAADIPLTYIKGDDGKIKVVQHMTLAHNDFLKLNRKMADERGYCVGCNIWDPLTTFLVPYADMIGLGEHWNKDGLPSINEFRAFRFLSYRKLLSTMDYVLNFGGGVPATPEGVKKYMEPRLNKCLLYGIFPGTANAWGQPEKAKLIVPVFKPYVPIFKAINEAGWEPVTRLAASGENERKVFRERWGNNTKEGLYFTLRNMADSEVVLQLAFSRKDFGKITYIKQLLEEKSLELKYAKGNYICSIQIPSKRTVVIKCE